LSEVFDDEVEDKMPRFIRKGIKCRRTTIVENKNAWWY
jgi:hypothetical protein